MFKLPTDAEMYFVALCLEGFLYGLYSGIFAMYLQYHASKQHTKKKNILFYSLCALYASSGSVFVCDITVCLLWYQHISPNLWMPRIPTMQTVLFACCDFIAQFLLIYRCWIVWGRNIRIVVIPSILAVMFLVIWMLSIQSSGSTLEDFGIYGGVPYRMTLTGLTLSLTVNALVTGLIVFRIFSVFREVRATSDDKILGATGGSKLRRIILVLIESAMVLFSVQLARLLVFILPTDAVTSPYSTTVVAHQMLNGITPTIILVRTSMGLSFHDEKSMEDVAVGSLRFASNHPNSVSETGSIGIVGQDIRDDDDVDVQRSNDIVVVER